MPKVSPMISSFNSGEFSPLMAGRIDYKYFTSACRHIRNFMLTRQGPARRRAGTKFVAEVKTSSQRTWLGKFEFNIEQAYVLEFGHQYIRFFSNHGVVGAPLEVVTPYTSADLVDANGFFNLRFVQSGDVLYIVHPNYAPRKLLRTGASAFSISALAPEGGPFKDIDPAQTVTVYSSAATGAGVTLTASAAIFLAGHVGSLFLIEQKNTDSIAQWEPGKAVALNAVRKSDGKNFHALNAATTGTIRPVHSFGAKYDGDTGVQWQYDDPGYGWAIITAIGGGGTTATADILSRIPDNAVGAGNASTRWAHAAWSDVEGWPDNVTFFRERLTFSRDRNVWLSVAGDFENFKNRNDSGLITAEQAIRGEITSDKANRIEWLAPSDLALLIGTAGDEHALAEITPSEAFGPANARARKQSEYGARHVQIARVGDGVLFVQKAGRKVRDMVLAESVNERWVATDVTARAEHITKGGVLDMAYQQEPDSILWCAMSDGRLSGFTLDREQDVRGWHQHRIGGYSDSYKTRFAIVESVVSIPSPDGDRDELWMIVQRYINGATKRYVEWMEYVHEEGDDPQDAFYVDSGLTLDNTKATTLTPGAGADVKGTVDVVFTAGAAIFVAGDVGRYIHYRYYAVDVTGKKTWAMAIALITAYTDTTHVKGTIILPWPNLAAIASAGWRMTVTSVSGLTHLAGETVSILADGATHADKVVSAGGVVTFDTAVSKAHIGLPCPAVLAPMQIEAGAADGVAETKTKRISRCGIFFHETSGAEYGRSEQETLDEVPSRSPDDLMDIAPPLFTGDVIVSWPDGYSEEGYISIVQRKPLPACVVGLVPQMVTQDNR